MAVAATLPAPPAAQRPRVLVVGTAFATAGALMFFAGLMGIYLARRTEVLTSGVAWIPDGVKIPLTQSNIMLFTLVASSIIVQWAAHAVARDDRSNAIVALGLSLVLGVAFINMETYLFELMKFDIAANQQSVLVYAIVGGHLAMLIAAMVFVAVMLLRVIVKRPTLSHRDGVSSAAMLWHASVAVYALIWITIFVTK